jgi:hypothetical protein
VSLVDDLAEPEPDMNLVAAFVFVDIGFTQLAKEAIHCRGPNGLSPTGFEVGLALSNLGLGESRDKGEDSEKLFIICVPSYRAGPAISCPRGP